MLEGYDYAWGYGPALPVALVKAGAHFVIRYIGTSSKCLTSAERTALHKAGIGIGLVYETTGLTFQGGESAGHADGLAAMDAAKKLGVPAGTPIYFAIDTDTSDYAKVREYLKGCSASCVGYVARLYAGFHVVEAVAVEGQWQTYAWSGGSVSAYADVLQYHNGVNVAGVSMDRCRTLSSDMVVTSGWLTRASAPAPAPKPNPVVHPVAAVKDRLRLAGNKNALAAAAVKREAHQVTSPTQSWKNLCASLVRQSYGISADKWGSVSRTAAEAWKLVPAKYQHSFYTAPLGVPVFWTGGSSGAGHVAISDGQGRVWSNDFGPSGYIGDGKVRLVPQAAISAHDPALKLAGWTELYLGTRVYN